MAYGESESSNTLQMSPVHVPPVPATIRIVYTTPNCRKEKMHCAAYAVSFNKAIEVYNAKDYAYALDLFHEADRAEPGNPQCVVMIGICLENTGKSDTALGVYSYALQLDEHYALAWHNKGVLLSNMGKHEEAKECYLNALRDRVLTGSPDFEVAAASLASCLVKMGEKTSATRVLEDLVCRMAISPTADHTIAAWLSDIQAEVKNPQRAYELLMNLPNDGFLKPDKLMLSKNKMADHLSSLCQPHSFLLPKAPRMANGYIAAIQSTVAKLVKEKPGSLLRVADLDSIGWLAMKAIQAGCKQASCYIRPWDTLKCHLTQVLQSNGYEASDVDIRNFAADKVDPFNDATEQFDLVINAVYTPASVPGILNRIKELQRKGMATVPHSGALKLMAISSEQIKLQTTAGSEVNGFDLTAFGDFSTAIRKYVMHMYMSTIKHDVLTEVVTVPINTDDNLQGMFQQVIDLPVTKRGKVDAIVTWYDLDLGGGQALSMGPDEDNMWQQNVQVVHFGSDDPVNVDDTIRLHSTVTRWNQERSHQYIMFEKIDHVARQSGEVVRVHDTMLLSEDPLEGRLWHFDMMSDIGRNDAYDRGLKAVVKPDSIVLDIGTGSGLLAMMAARAGAKHVYAIEANPDIAEKARKVIKANGYHDKITVLTGKSDDIKAGEGELMPVKADIVVTETMGADLLSELMYNILDDARERLLKPGAIMVPGAGRVIGQLVQIDAPWHTAGFPSGKSTSELDLSAFNPMLPPMRTCVHIQKTKFTPLTEVFSLFDFNFSQPINKVGNTREITVPITMAGKCHAILFWWDADLGEDSEGRIIIETGPQSRYAYVDHAHWSQQLQVLDFDGVPVQPKQEMSFKLYNDNHLSFAELVR
uniref:Protein arginine N-methyltransferase domain-containing protein n=1 Tax=Eutreptiella gymnastica TaxID=73025 RepID=A0A7S1NFQ9_9EUGL|mmetsp:Transcript_28234/g.50782  ORF Transcript_28234/g.50782 Transcript_28234/m.50782 type:complete len:871 (+) Transcript_28234:55-2667(+)